MNIAGEIAVPAKGPGALLQASEEPWASDFTTFDQHLFCEGTHSRLYEKLGCHAGFENGAAGAHFSIWAPNAQRVFVTGDFNDWSAGAHPLSACGDAGIWSGFVAGAQHGGAYQYCVIPKDGGDRQSKTDPFSWRLEGAPRHASFVWDLDFTWTDADWLRERARRNSISAPISIYELQLGSWRRVPEEGNRWLRYQEAAPLLVEHLKRTGFTHVLLEPLMQSATWFPRDEGVAGFFAADSRFGTPQELMSLISTLHQNGFAVLMHWDPTRFPGGEHGLEKLGGSRLYEHEFQARVARVDGSELRFDINRPEVRSFLLSSAMFWLDRFHIDGLNISAGAILAVPELADDGTRMLRQLSAEVQKSFPGVLLIGEGVENHPAATGWPGEQSLGLTLARKDSFQAETTALFSSDYSARSSIHHQLTRWEESEGPKRFLLPLGRPGRDEQPHSLLSQMAGDDWQRAANYKLCLGFQWLQPGKKLLFMGNEFAQWQPWNPLTSLDWHLIEHRPHRCILRWLEDLNRSYREEPGLHLGDCDNDGLEWVGSDPGTLAWLRRDPDRRDVFLVACNLTPAVLRNVFLGVRRPGYWREMLNSDSQEYGGTEQGNFGGLCTAPFASRGLPHTLTITLPPLAIVIFKHHAS